MILEQIIRWQEAERNDARKLGITVTAYHLLALIAMADGKYKMTQLAGLLGVTIESAHQSASGLIKKGLIWKAGSIRDRRIKYLNLTHTGADALAKLHTTKKSA